MKIRNGFVSNSSSSSFIVKDIDGVFNKGSKKGRLTKKDINKLEGYGFKSTHLMHPSHLDSTDYRDKSVWEPLIDKDTNEIIIRNFGLHVSCNQDEVIEYLVSNNISFIATIHYGQQLYLFNKGDENIMVFENFGSIVETYYQDASWEKIKGQLELFGNPVPYYQIPIEEIKEKNEN